MISGFHRVLNIVCVLLGISPASVCVLPTFRNPLSVPSSRAGSKYISFLLPALEDGTDRGFRNVGRTQTDAGDIPKRTHTRSNQYLNKRAGLFTAMNKLQHQLICDANEYCTFLDNVQAPPCV